MSDHDDRALEARLRRHLDEEAANLDGATRSRLRQARARALAAAEARSTSHPRWWLPAGAALASLVAVVLWWGREPPPSPLAPIDFELLTEQAAPENYRDLDFYLWLEQEAERAG